MLLTGNVCDQVQRRKCSLSSAAHRTVLPESHTKAAHCMWDEHVQAARYVEGLACRVEGRAANSAEDGALASSTYDDDADADSDMVLARSK
eukprot:scaffold136117_cov19-Tisochrysis_lutea.AAC.1